MKTRILLVMFSLMALLMPQCLPTDEVDPDDPIAKFLGEWDVDETCQRLNYSVSIEADPGNSAQVLIYNFGSTGSGYDPAVGLVVTSKIYVETQTIGEGWTVSGEGTYQSDGTISWSYTLIIPPEQYSCTAVFSK